MVSHGGEFFHTMARADRFAVRLSQYGDYVLDWMCASPLAADPRPMTLPRSLPIGY